jgi:prepilin-type N-terminal cleavage/methylation domain-containing protein
MILAGKQKGLSLIETMVALAVGGIVIAGVYQTFTAQHKSFTVQEEVFQAQASTRAVMDLVARDIRMAGFGAPAWAVAGLTNRVTIDQTSPADFTIVGVFGGPVAKLSNPANMGQNQIDLDSIGQSLGFTAGDNLLIYESDRPVPPILGAGEVLGAPLRYRTVVVWANVEGTDPTVSIDVDGATPAVQDGLDLDLRANALLYRIGTVQYQLVGNNLLRNGSVLATDVTAFQITDLFNPGPPVVSDTFGSYQIALTVRTRTNDPDFPGGWRTRRLTSTIKARNLILDS